jgi:aspartyl-tRNA synthetase
LQEAGVEVDPLGDLNTESERKLGQLVLEKYVNFVWLLRSVLLPFLFAKQFI